MRKKPVDSNRLRVVVCIYADNCEITAKLVSGKSSVTCSHKEMHAFNHNTCADR